LFLDINELFEQSPESRWGIVTNKPGAFTEPLLQQLGIAKLWGSVVSGDRLPQRKPDPAPLLLAARELGVDASACVYVGDAPRDIEAGRAAGMTTVAAAFGYIRPSENPASWGADAVVSQPWQLAAVIRDLRDRSAA